MKIQKKIISLNISLKTPQIALISFILNFFTQKNCDYNTCHIFDAFKHNNFRSKVEFEKYFYKYQAPSPLDFIPHNILNKIQIGFHKPCHAYYVMIMLPLSRKPEIIRLHNLEQIQRGRYIGNSVNVGYEWVPEKFWPILPISADLYYTFMTICKCRKRLGEQYTYVAKYNEKHYEEEGVLMNDRYRLIMFVLEILQRHLIKKLLHMLFEKIQTSRRPILRQLSLLGEEGMLEHGKMFMMMLFMLGWNKHFNVIDTILGTQYIYTYKNADQKSSNYRIEGLMLLTVFAVKVMRLVFNLVTEGKKKISPKEQRIKADFKVMEDQKEESEISEGELCRICYDTMKNASSTCCGHIFCWGCLVKHLQMHPQCPVCRAKCLPRQVVQLQNY